MVQYSQIKISVESNFNMDIFFSDNVQNIIRINILKVPVIRDAALAAILKNGRQFRVYIRFSSINFWIMTDRIEIPI